MRRLSLLAVVCGLMLATPTQAKMFEVTCKTPPGSWVYEPSSLRSVENNWTFTAVNNFKNRVLQMWLPDIRAVSFTLELVENKSEAEAVTCEVK